MAVDPATISLLVSQVTSAITNEEKRNSIVLLITILVSITLLIVMIPIYILTSPIETLNSILSQDEQSMVQDIKNIYRIDYGMGNITINGKLGFPLEHNENITITAEYGMYDPWNTGTQSKHTGIDMSGVHRDNVLAVEKGIITFAGVQNGYGNCIEIKHIIDGQELYTFYAHLSAIGVIEGQEVEQGYIIGKEGGDPYTDLNAGNSTGHHLHFEVRTASGYGNDINPKEYIFSD